MLETAPQASSDTAAAKTTQCGGCHQSVESDSTGIVVAFGSVNVSVACSVMTSACLLMLTTRISALHESLVKLYGT